MVVTRPDLCACHPGADPGIFDRWVPGFSRKYEVEGEFLEVDGSTELLLKGVEGCLVESPRKKKEISD